MKRRILLNKRNFDVALLDMMMPGLSGVEVLDRLAADSRDVQVILLTAQGTVDSAVKAMKLVHLRLFDETLPVGRARSSH